MAGNIMNAWLARNASQLVYSGSSSLLPASRDHPDPIFSSVWINRVLGEDRPYWEHIAASCSPKVKLPTLTCTPSCLKSCGKNGKATATLQEEDIGKTVCMHMPLDNHICMLNRHGLGPKGSFCEGTACDDLQKKLSKATCEDAFGCHAYCLQVCRFSNLYSSGDPKASKLVAHIVRGLDPSFPVQRVELLRDSPVTVTVHETLQDFARFLSKSEIIPQPNLSLAMAPLYHNNIGHALYDYLYPAFISLIQLQLHHLAYRTVLQISERAYSNDLKLVKLQRASEGIYSQFGGAGLLITNELKAIHCFEDIVVGAGAHRDEWDMNVNYSLSGGRDLDSVRLFRTRIYTSFDLVPPRSRRYSNENRDRNKPLFAILVENMLGRDAVTAASLHGVKLHYIDWVKSFESFAVGPARFREHLELLAKTDIYISTPGTKIMYQHFMPDGSLVINLGGSRGFMDEFVTEGAPYLRALHAKLSADRKIASEQIVALAALGHELIFSGFAIPVPVGVNLSPTATVFKAYAHLTLRNFPAILPLINLRHLREFRCVGIGNIAGFVMARNGTRGKPYPHPDPTKYKRCIADNTCLLQALTESYNRLDPNHMNWF